MGSTSFLKLNQDLEANFETVDGRTPRRRSNLNCAHWQRPLFISPAISPTIIAIHTCPSENQFSNRYDPKTNFPTSSNPTNCLRTVVRSNLLNVLEQVNSMFYVTLFIFFVTLDLTSIYLTSHPIFTCMSNKSRLSL